jgi:hypothetical protein
LAAEDAAPVEPRAVRLDVEPDAAGAADVAALAAIGITVEGCGPNIGDHDARAASPAY